MVLDFLEQLSAALPSTEEEVKDVLRGKFKSPRKLELRLTDRKKLSNDGYTGPQCFVCYLMRAGLLARAHIFSRREFVGALYPLVRLQQRAPT